MNRVVLQERKISAITHRHITAALREILSDQDRGLALKAGFVNRIKKSLHAKNAGKVKNLKEMLAKHGVV